jgi:hypothetical protein
MTYCYHPNKLKMTMQFETLVFRLRHEPYVEGSSFEPQLHLCDFSVHGCKSLLKVMLCEYDYRSPLLKNHSHDRAIIKDKRDPLMGNLVRAGSVQKFNENNVWTHWTNSNNAIL